VAPEIKRSQAVRSAFLALIHTKINSIYLVIREGELGLLFHHPLTADLAFLMRFSSGSAPATSVLSTCVSACAFATPGNVHTTNRSALIDIFSLFVSLLFA
jgi:hypothetical protein